jgi:ATP-dependent DNA helicase RecG
MQRKKETEKYFSKLMQLGIYSPIQALYYFPKRIEYINIKPFSPELTEGYFRGIVQGASRIVRYRKVPFVQFKFMTNNQLISVIAFNQTYLAKVLEPEMSIVIHAKKSSRNWIASKVFYRKTPIQHESEYALLKGMRQAKFRDYLRKCLVEVKIHDFLPEALHRKYQLIERKRAFTRMHFPQNETEKAEAIRYFKYEEAFLFYLQLLVRQQEIQQVVGKNKAIKQEAVDRFTSQLPFVLTAAQTRVIDEVLADFNSEKLMHRLLQGDVGSGKTIIALLAAYVQIAQGYQVVFLAPTTILAEQHLYEAQKYVTPLGVRVGFLRSQMKKREREQLIEDLRTGAIQLLIGTHALLEDDIVFQNLGFGIIDEQQRFGVEQRKLLRAKGALVDMLYMSATPIPRTLAISLFGDLSVSTIDELPAGRVKIATSIVRKREWTRVIAKIEETIGRGEQVYIVCPLIEASETLDLGNLLHVYEKVKRDLPPDILVGMLHGKQKNEEKQSTIADFTNEKIQVLVSTTVVEVGVHVDKATLMVIYDAQQFGLSQLHQLRGRVGRSSRAAQCVLISDQQNKRLELLTRSQDGFFLAQQDLVLRGPGDFFGSKQSGLPSFKLVNLLEDVKLLEAAKADAYETISRLSTLIGDERKQYAKIEEYIALRKKDITDFID